MLSSPRKSRQQAPENDFPFIPPEMFLIFPTEKIDFYMGEGKTIRRFIFHGIGLEESITDFEKKKLQEFLEFIENNKKTLPMGILNDPYWTLTWKFRWLSSQQFQFKPTIKAIQKHSEYLKQNRTNPPEKIVKFLVQKLGLFYICGRDAHYRPILVFDVEKMLTSKISEEELIESQKYFFEKIMNQYLLPGQVETWVAIIDVGYQNMLSVVGPLKKSIGFLSNTFRCRMKVAYLVRCPASISFVWSIAKKFMHPDTVEKINFMDSELIPPLMEFTNPSQVQERYGGKQSNMTEYWPLKPASQLSKDYTHPKVHINFISSALYSDLYSREKLHDHYINRAIIEDFISQIEKKQHSHQISSNQDQKNLLLAQKLKIECLPEEQTPMQISLQGIPAVISWQSLISFIEK